MTAPVPIDVRDATPADAPAIAALLATLGYPSDAAAVAARLDALLAGAGDRVLVAHGDDGRVVGVLSLHVVPMLAEPGRLARITALAVADDARRLGVGRALVARAEVAAADAHCNVVEVSSGRRPERAAAHGFYPALGYVDAGVSHVRYWKRLD